MTSRSRLILTSLILTLTVVSGRGTLLAQLPTPTYGWNLGNTLEPPSGEGSWGPAATRTLINSVADAGFNTVRIPCAWDSHADPVTHTIDPEWMKRVRQVVGWCQARKLHVILNSHWDKGWIENKVTDTVDPVINAKMRSYWSQIAVAFAEADETLLFAGANEPAIETPEQMRTLLAYYQTFVDAVRATGGRNATRWLVVQGPATDIDKTDALMASLPSDPTPNRLAVEVHFYSPYQWCLMTEDASWGKRVYFWGKPYHHPARSDRNAASQEEGFVEAQFQKMKVKFVDKGIPVILGEFQAMKREGNQDLTGADFALHAASRAYFHHKVVSLANGMGIKPIYWDIPDQLFDWKSGRLLDPENACVLTGGLPPPPQRELCVRAMGRGEQTRALRVGDASGSGSQPPPSAGPRTQPAK